KLSYDNILGAFLEHRFYYRNKPSAFKGELDVRIFSKKKDRISILFKKTKLKDEKDNTYELREIILLEFMKTILNYTKLVHKKHCSTNMLEVEIIDPTSSIIFTSNAIDISMTVRDII